MCQTLKGDSGWSAVTVMSFSSPTIIYNPVHSAARQQSNFMHEMAHLIEEHEPSGFDWSKGLPCRSYDRAQEDEAAWLGGCLQIPRKAMLRAVSRGMDNETIARHYTASTQMVQFRRNVTGVDQQLKNRW